MSTPQGLMKALRKELDGALEVNGDEVTVLPTTRRDIGRALGIAAKHRARVDAPGSEAPGGDDDRPSFRIDLRRMSAMLKFDEVSRVAHVQAGMRVHTLEDELRRRGLTLGAHSVARDYTIGEWLALGAPGGRDRDDDPVDQLVAGIEFVLPDGKEVHVRPAPRRAVGPDLIDALIGARGKLGVIIGAHVCTRRRVQSDAIGFLFPTRGGAESALAWMRGYGVRPVRAYVRDVAEGSALRLKLPQPNGTGDLPSVWREICDECAKEHGGIKMAKRDLPGARPSKGAPPSAIVSELAAQLDPRGILS